MEIWNRWLNNPLPGEVLGLLNHSEDNLRPFYDNLLETFTRMQRELSEKRSWWGWWRRAPIKVHGPIIAVNPFATPKETPEMAVLKRSFETLQFPDWQAF